MNTNPIPVSSGRLRGEAGFTLIEALCAIVILAFGLIAVANLLLVASTSNSTANMSTAATTLAVQQLEVLKGVPFNDPGGLLVAGGDLESDQGGFFTNPPAEIPGVGQIRVRWTIVDIDPQTKFISVRAESTALLIGARSRAEFTVFRSCTDATPAPGLACPPVP